MLNKKLGVLAGTGAVAAFILLWATLRQHWLGHNPIVEQMLQFVLGVIGFPLRLYVMFVMGGNGSWALPMLVLLLAVTGVFWGVLASIVWRRQS